MITFDSKKYKKIVCVVFGLTILKFNRKLMLS